MTGIVFHIQRFSLFDGPGVRTVVFLKGCPLRCVWCHNPEGISVRPQVMFQSSRCIGCGDCVGVCPQGCHTLQDGRHSFQRENCIGCGKCAQVCCSMALTMAGQTMESREVIDQVKKDLSLFQESGGGMTLSGGEPLFQSEFALALLQEAKANGISTCIETCGQASEAVMRRAALYTDVFYYDYKATGAAMHQELCGVTQERILSNLSLLDELGAQVVLRCPIVPGANEVPFHIEGIGRTAAIHSCIKEIQLEPYHKLGVSKAEQLGQYGTYDTNVPRRADLESYCSKIREFCGKKCSIS